MRRLPRLLLVDDEPDVLRSLHDLLGLLPGADIVPAASYADARDLLAAGPWDAVVADQRLADGHGLDLLAEAGRRSPRTVLVLMSAFQDFDATLRGSNAAHVDRFFQKPVDPEGLLRWLERALQDRAAGKGDPGRSRPFRRIGSPDARPGGDLRRL